jgi:hypothetical protein
VKRLVTAGGEGVRLVVWDLSTSPHVDIAGARNARRSFARAWRGGIELRLAEAHATVRGLSERRRGRTRGDAGRRLSVDEVIEGHARPSVAAAG